MNIIEKVNRSRYTLKQILSTEWDTSVIPELSNQEIEKIYSIQSASISPFPGVATGCNFKPFFYLRARIKVIKMFNKKFI